MSEQKPKIDLKARLGKKAPSSPAAGGSIPPPGPAAVPAQRPSVPQRPSAPQHPGMQAHPSMPGAQPVGASRGPAAIPAPPFGAPAAAAPRIDPSNPYGSMPAQAVPAQARAIRVEIGEEVMQAQRRGRGKVAVLALITAVIGGGVGFTAGGGAERAAGAETAISGAKDLIKEIEKANAEVQRLADTLKGTKDKLSKGQFPEQEVSALGDINIPFGGKNLAGKGIGRFKPEVITMLIDYASGAQDANSQKEKLQSVLSGTKKGIVELLEQRDKPLVRWAVLLGNTSAGPWGSMQMLPAPFNAKDKWPDEFKLGSGKQEAVFKRYTSGNPISEQSPYYIPVDPSSQGSVCPSDVIVRLRREVGDLETVLRGDNTPGEDRPGLIDSARKLTERLKQIGSS